MTDMQCHLFSHALLLDKEVPTNQAMPAHFQMDGLNRYRGRPRTASWHLDTNLQQIGMRLKTTANLEQVRRITKIKPTGANYTEQQLNGSGARASCSRKLAITTATDTFNNIYACAASFSLINVKCFEEHHNLL